MSRYHQQVTAALDAVKVHGTMQYAWLGRRSRRLPRALDADLDDTERRRYLVAGLREELYYSFYCHGRPVAARWGEPQPVAPDPTLLAAMTDANTGHGGWEPGWTVERVEGDSAVVVGERLRVRVPLTACAGTVRPEAAVSIRFPQELPAFSPGYWTVLGDASLNSSDAGTVRVYWNVTLGGAAALVAAITSDLNSAGIPFRLKVADHPFRMGRCDAAVLYLGGDAFRGVRARLRAMAGSLAPHLQPETPAFTLELAKGIGLAEDDSGESFGISRCALLADGIVRAYEQDVGAVTDGVRVVAARFAEDGVDLDAPYRAPSLAGRHVL